jgi:hypothetical protein
MKHAYLLILDDQHDTFPDDQPYLPVYVAGVMHFSGYTSAKVTSLNPTLNVLSDNGINGSSSGADVVDELLQALNLAGIQSDDELDAAFGTVPDLHDEYDDDDEAAVDEADEAAR